MKRNALIRCAAWLLTLCAVMPMAVACGDDTEKQPETTTAEKKETETIDENDPYADRLKVSDDRGEYDFGEYEYRIVCTDGKELYVQDEDSADTVDSAIYRRNRAVEDRFNCKITVVKDASMGDDPVAYVSKVVSVGDNAFDLASAHVIGMGGLVPNMYFLNWYDIPNVNFDKPWWSDSNKDLLTHNDVCYVAIGDLALTAMYQAYCMFYNKRIGADYDMPDM
ncbi:MAG: hypothetical protein J6S76_03465, partial [Clostridia bacterium]|nr:hypothetical protein [Clostridia bacterium]